MSALCLGSCLIYPEASNNTEKLERKLVSVGEVEGLVVGAFTEVSAATHTLIVHLAKSSVQVARPQLGSRGQLRSEEAEIALTTAFLRRTFSICAVKALAFSLLLRVGGVKMLIRSICGGGNDRHTVFV